MKSGLMPTKAKKRTGALDVAPGRVTRSDSMNQGSFANRGGEIPMTPEASMKQGKKNRPGTIAPGKVPRVRSSMRQG